MRFSSGRDFAGAASELHRLVDQLRGELRVAHAGRDGKTVAGFVAEAGGTGEGPVGLGCLVHDSRMRKPRGGSCGSSQAVRFVEDGVIVGLTGGIAGSIE